MKKILIINCFVVIGKIAIAQSTVIVTDRPDITESAEIVPTGWLQGEHGFQYTFDNNQQFDIASSLMRFGLNTHTELRLGVEPSLTFDEPNIIYNQRISIGAKSVFLNKDKFKLALLTAIGTHLTQIELTGMSSTADIVLLGSVDVFDFWSIGINAGGNWLSDETGANVNYSISNALALGETCGYFIEIFGQRSPRDYGSTAIDIGFTYLINNNFQLDISGGYFFESEITFLSTGLSYRFEL